MKHTPNPSLLACAAPDSRAQAIAGTALKLQHSVPQAPALELLDLAMQAHRAGEFPDFDAPGVPPACSAFLPSPFARLLRAAFAPDWSDEDFAPATRNSRGTANDTSSQMWALQVLAEFSDRYGLTHARERWRYVF